MPIDYKKLAVESAKSTDTYQENKGTVQQGADYYNKAEGAYDNAVDLYEFATARIGEYDGGSWSGSALTDPGLAGLRKTLDEAAKAGPAAREAREANFRKGYAAAAGLALLIPGVGYAVAAAIVVIGEGLLQFGKLFAKDDPGNSSEHRRAAENAVTELWTKWRMAPPVFASDVSNAMGYASAVRDCITLLDSTNQGPNEWRTAWVRTVDNAMGLVAEKKLNVLRDAAMAGWFPVNIAEWCMIGHYCGGTMTPGCTHQGWTVLSKLDGLGRPLAWGEKYPQKREKDGGWTYGYARTIAQMRGATDKYAAGIGIMVAAAMPKPAWEKCIETAVTRNVAHAGNIDPSPAMQAWRLRATFLDTMKVAGVTTSALLALDPTVFNRNSRATQPLILPAAVGIVAGLAFGGPIGIAVGIGALVVSKMFNSKK